MYLPRHVLEDLHDRVKRVADAASSAHGALPMRIRSLIEFVDSKPSLRTLVASLKYEPRLNRPVDDLWFKEIDAEMTRRSVDQSAEHFAARSWYVLNTVSADNSACIHLIDYLRYKANFGVALVEYCLRPLLDFIFDAAESATLIHDVLLRYKQRSESFNNDELFAVIQQAETGTLEHRLANDLYRYLFDQGLDFHVEPTQSAGQPDFVPAVKSEDETWVGEVKAYSVKSPTVSQIEHNLSQLRAYLSGARPTTGYLVIFNAAASTHELVIDSDYENSRAPVMQLGSKSIVIVVVELREPGGPTASQGKRKEVKINRSID